MNSKNIHVWCDELPAFITVDMFTYEALKRKISFHEFHNTKLVSYEADNDLLIQTSDFVSIMPKFFTENTYWSAIWIISYVYKNPLIFNMLKPY